MARAPANAVLAPMEARLVANLPTGRGWQYEPKWDGFRCIAVRAGSQVSLQAKSGKPLGRFFPEVMAVLAGLPREDFILDGELVIPADGAHSFDALQMRLHPAESRIRTLAAATPAVYMLFDALLLQGKPLASQSLQARRTRLESFIRRAHRSGSAARRGLQLTPATASLKTAQRWIRGTARSYDGIIAKPIEQPYLPGERAMLKWKPLRTADCVVGGFRYASNGPEVGSLLLGLYNAQGQLDHVGFISGLSAKDRPALTRKLEALRAPPGFTGKAPGGPSRWSTERSAQWQPLAASLVVEVQYDQVTNQRFRHGTRLLRWRPDKAPRQCLMEQLGKMEPSQPSVAKQRPRSARAATSRATSR